MDALVRQLLPYVGRICGAIALDKGDDAVQETMIAVLRSVRGLRDPDALRPWVRRIAVREALRVGRHGAFPVDPHSVEAAAPVMDVDAAMDVRKVLSQLTPDQRAILVLRDMEGGAEADVARILSVPEGTAKSRLHRARKAFEARWTR